MVIYVILPYTLFKVRVRGGQFVFCVGGMVVWC